MPPELNSRRSELDATINEIGQTLAGLDPGALASLRRMSLDGEDYGAPYFWRLAARHDFGRDMQDAWARVIRIMAILTDKGSPGNKRSPHASHTTGGGWRGLGHALCDGGDPTWGQGQPDPRPMLSEERFARLLAARGQARAELMLRAARSLAAQKPAGAGVNCTDLARFLLFPDDPSPARALARDYYARLDRAGAKNEAEIADQIGGDA